MELLKCGQCGNRPGLLVTVTDRAADTSINLRYECYKMYARAIERALKAEALARELVAALQRVSGMLDYATGECRCGVCEYCNVQKRVDKALAKAKEVLGDEIK